MRSLAISLGLGLLASSCANNEVVVGPDGSPNHLVRCMTIETCYSDARRICGGNYKIVNTSTETNSSTNGVFSMQDLLVKCQNEAKAVQPSAEEPRANPPASGANPDPEQASHAPPSSK